MKKHLLTIIFAALFVACDSEQNQANLFEDDFLSVEFLNSDRRMNSPSDTGAYLPPAQGKLKGAGIMGVMRLESDEHHARVEVIEDSQAIVANSALKIAQFPAIAFEIVSDGQTVIPLVQTPQRTTHPYWEVILQTGKQWQDPVNENWTRVSLPFALKQKNQNCIHNGMLSFAHKADGQISRVAWQISSETCKYLKINLWGTLNATYQPGLVASAAELIAANLVHRISRVSVKPIESLIYDYPTLPLQGLLPGDLENISAHGFVMKGIHYQGTCQTRHGLYPFCEEMVLPSYSLAKSIIGGLGFLYMINKWPEFESLTVPELIPECRLPDERWQGVTMSHLINMTTGNYDDVRHANDEGAQKMEAFFDAESHEKRLEHSCKAWPRRSDPGSKVVYHTSDTYLLGTAMNAWLRARSSEDADIFNDVLFSEFLEPLNLSPLMSWTQRTYDQQAQPFTGYGLVMKSDDLVRIALFLNAFFEDQDIFRIFNGGTQKVTGLDLAYRNGFWGFEVTTLLNCKQETWVPFMSGFGGVSVALFPNSTIYYHFSDADYYSFKDAAIASHELIKMCN